MSLNFTLQVIRVSKQVEHKFGYVFFFFFFMPQIKSVCSREWKLMTLSAVVMVSMTLNSDHYEF